MGRLSLVSGLLSPDDCGHGVSARRTSFVDNNKVEKVIPKQTVDSVLKMFDTFDSDFQAYAKTDKNFPPQVLKRWNTVYNLKDPLRKVVDRLWQCTNYEQALTGPRPDTKGQVGDELMKSSVSARVNAVVRESGELVAFREGGAAHW